MPAPKRRLFAAFLGLAVILALFLPYLLPRPTPRYTVTDLGVLPGDKESVAFAINSAGVAVGDSSGAGEQACVFKNGTVIKLGGPPGGSRSSARGINSQGEVTGDLNLGTAHHAFLYSLGKMHDLGTLSGFSDSKGSAINDRGEIIGDVSQISSTGGTWRITNNAFLYSHSKMTNLTALPSMAQGDARSINAAGQIAGSVIGAPFLYDSRIKTKTTLPLPPRARWGHAYHINDHGQVAGMVMMRDGTFHVVLWQGSQSSDLGTLPGDIFFRVRGLNNQGVIVGGSFILDSPVKTFLQTHVPAGNPLRRYLDRNTDRAFVSQSGKLVDLNTLISADADWVLEGAYGINDRGQIVGEGLHHGQGRAFLLTPR